MTELEFLKKFDETLRAFKADRSQKYQTLEERARHNGLVRGGFEDVGNPILPLLWRLSKMDEYREARIEGRIRKFFFRLAGGHLQKEGLSLHDLIALKEAYEWYRVQSLVEA